MKSEAIITKYLEDDKDSMFKLYIDMLNLPKKDVQSVSASKRLINLPLATLNWLALCFCYSFFCGILVILLGLALIFDDEEPTGMGFVFLTAPILFPIVWWVRYFKFGEYGNVI